MGRWRARLYRADGWRIREIGVVEAPTLEGLLDKLSMKDFHYATLEYEGPGGVVKLAGNGSLMVYPWPPVINKKKLK